MGDRLPLQGSWGGHQNRRGGPGNGKIRQSMECALHHPVPQDGQEHFQHPEFQKRGGNEVVS